MAKRVFVDPLSESNRTTVEKGPSVGRTRRAPLPLVSARGRHNPRRASCAAETLLNGLRGRSGRKNRRLRCWHSGVPSTAVLPKFSPTSLGTPAVPAGLCRECGSGGGTSIPNSQLCFTRSGRGSRAISARRVCVLRLLPSHGAHLNGATHAAPAGCRGKTNSPAFSPVYVLMPPPVRCRA